MTESTLSNRTIGAFDLFTIGSFLVAAAMVAGGIYNLEASFAAKGFYAMSTLMMVHTTVGITKLLRDGSEAERLSNQIDKARTEKLLREMDAKI